MLLGHLRTVILQSDTLIENMNKSVVRLLKMKLYDIVDTECLSSTTTKMADAYSTTDHLINTTDTKTPRNDSLQPKSNYKRKAVVNNATDSKVPKNTYRQHKEQGS